MDFLQKERDAILSSGFEIVDDYSLVNNYGYKIKLNNTEYDLRHWKNIYGIEVDYWSVDNKSKASEEDRKKIEELEKKMTREL